MESCVGLLNLSRRTRYRLSKAILDDSGGSSTVHARESLRHNFMSYKVATVLNTYVWQVGYSIRETDNAQHLVKHFIYVMHVSGYHLSLLKCR